MIDRSDLRQLTERAYTGRPVLSLFLDMRPGGDHRRAHEVFIQGQRGRADELARRSGVDRAEVEEGLDRARDWLEHDFEPENRGVAIYLELGGDWMETLQIPVPLPARLLVERRPVVAPLYQALQGRRRHVIAQLDRSHIRMFEVWLGRLQSHREVRLDPYPAAHDVQGGGPASPRYQRHKLEEEKHFFGELARALEDFVTETGAEDVVLLGTSENVAHFRRMLPLRLAARVSYAGNAPADAPLSELLERMQHLESMDPEGIELLATVRERTSTGSRAAAGVQPTLAALQAGRAEAVLLPDDPSATAWRCTRCGHLFADEVDSCPFDQAPVEGGVPVVEEALRLAWEQDARARVLPREVVEEFSGAAALLRF